MKTASSHISKFIANDKIPHLFPKLITEDGLFGLLLVALKDSGWYRLWTRVCRLKLAGGRCLLHSDIRSKSINLKFKKSKKKCKSENSEKKQVKRQVGNGNLIHFPLFFFPLPRSNFHFHPFSVHFLNSPITSMFQNLCAGTTCPSSNQLKQNRLQLSFLQWLVEFFEVVKI